MRALGVHASTTIESVSLMLMGTSIYKPMVFRSDLRLSRVGYAEDGQPTSS